MVYFVGGLVGEEVTVDGEDGLSSLTFMLSVAVRCGIDTLALDTENRGIICPAVGCRNLREGGMIRGAVDAEVVVFSGVGGDDDCNDVKGSVEFGPFV